MADLRSEILKKIEQNCVDFADVMTKLEQLHPSETLTINAQVKLITELANCPKFKPQNAIDAEQRLNGLLRYLTSANYIVRSLACSLMKIFCDFLDVSGQHIATQVMISCKNLLTVITKTEDKSNYGLTICQSIALSSMCSIATEWSCKLAQLNQWFPLALLSLNTVFGVLLNNKMHSFIQQVAAEGLKWTLNIPNFWSSLTNTERIDTLSHIKQVFDIWIPKPDAFILIRLLQTVANKAVAWSACQSRYLKYFLQVCVKCLPEMKESELDKGMPLDVRWAALKLLWRLLNGMKMQNIAYQGVQWEIYLEKLKSLFADGLVSSIHSIQKLKEQIGHLVSKL